MASRPQVVPLPSDSSIQVVEDSAERLVIVIPRGGKHAGSMGRFAWFWLTVMTICSVCASFGMVVDPARWEREKQPDWATLAAFSVFWAVGIGLSIAWVQMRFTRVTLVLEPGRLMLQRDLFSNTKVSTLELDKTSHAHSKLAYAENTRRIFRVCVTGIGRQEKFGAALSRSEQAWLTSTINDRLKTTAVATPVSGKPPSRNRLDLR